MHRTEVHTDLFSRHLSIYSAKSNECQPLSGLTSKPKHDLEHFPLAREIILGVDLQKERIRVEGGES